jgi:hypothetical protein
VCLTLTLIKTEHQISNCEPPAAIRLHSWLGKQKAAHIIDLINCDVKTWHMSHFRSGGRRVKVESRAFSSKTWKESSVLSFTLRPPCPKGKCAWYQADKTQADPQSPGRQNIFKYSCRALNINLFEEHLKSISSYLNGQKSASITRLLCYNVNAV